jgi:modulator of FtsH protease
MNETPTLRPDLSVPRERSAIGVFGWVMGLVALAIAFLALGSYLGRDLSRGAALACSLVGLGMLLVQSFGGERFRRGSFAMGWLFGLATMIGLGLGSFIAYYVEFNRDALAQAFAGTAATVLAMASLGLFLSKDLAPWMKPVSLTAFVLLGVAIVWSIFAGPLPAFMSILIYGISALLLVIDFNYLRKHGTENDAIWLATGIFVSIVNIFTSLLSLFSD